MINSMERNNALMMLSFSLSFSLNKIEEIISSETSFFKIKAEQLKVKIQWSLIQLRSPFGLNTSADMMKVKRST
jgi:hypothetical protein